MVTATPFDTRHILLGVPSAFSEAKFLADLVGHGLISEDEARELITIDAGEEAVLISAVETAFDARLVRAAVVFRRQVLEHFDRLLSPPDPAISDADSAAIDYLMALR